MSLAAFTFANVGASQTDSVLLAAIPNRIIVVLGVAFDCVGAPTDLTFNSKGSGSGTAITPTWSMSQNAGFVLPVSETGWFATNSGEALTCTTSAGSTVAIQVVYKYRNTPGATS